ncbi:hypothetical protein ACFQY9_06740 [Microvirga aerilata]|uniref:hypothetical protein n=1 Tax=Microvirga aerilata TaxID=670292 RepID=UPI003645026C
MTVDGAYADNQLAERLWQLRNWTRPDEPLARAKFLQDAFEEVLKAVTPRYNARRPSARLARLFCAMFPRDTVCLLAHYMTGWVRRAFRIPKSGWDLIGQQVLFREKLRSELGPETDLSDDIERSQFAWYMLVKVRPTDDGAIDISPTGNPTESDVREAKANSTQLPVRILPVEVQSKGLSYIRDNISLILGALRASEHGATRDDLIRQILSDAPFLNRNSAQSAFATIPRLGLIELRDGAYYPTERGLALLDGEPPGDVITPVIIARVFGVAHILNELRNAKGTLVQGELAERLQSYYPNWTTTFAPTALFQWLLALKLIISKPGSGGRKELSLTEAGEEWAAIVPTDMSAWKIERSDAEATAISNIALDGLGTAAANDMVTDKAPLRPADLTDVRERFKTLDLVGLEETLSLVHHALHALPGKRFVLLAGLSGTGKSALARGYAQAYCEALNLHVDEHRLELAVRPDWIDPGGFSASSTQLVTRRDFRRPMRCDFF